MNICKTLFAIPWLHAFSHGEKLEFSKFWVYLTFPFLVSFSADLEFEDGEELLVSFLYARWSCFQKEAVWRWETRASKYLSWAIEGKKSANAFFPFQHLCARSVMFLTCPPLPLCNMFYGVLERQYFLVNLTDYSRGTPGREEFL